ncbi:MAG: hypothetical protein GY746_17240 [Gammaproteobacteria bacterium]|nr:hypothetical protein [Gammaproteobacteria bacterium]
MKMKWLAIAVLLVFAASVQAESKIKLNPWKELVRPNCAGEDCLDSDYKTHKKKKKELERERRRAEKKQRKAEKRAEKKRRKAEKRAERARKKAERREAKRQKKEAKRLARKRQRAYCKENSKSATANSTAICR